MLTDRQIKTHPAPPKDTFIADRHGLYLRVRPNGSKTFVVRRKTSGKTQWVTLGSYPAMSLLDARKRALDMVGRSVGPAVTVRQLFEEFDVRVLSKQAAGGHAKQRLSSDIVPRLGHFKADRVTRAQLTAILQDVVDRGAPVQANRMLTAASLMFDYAVQRGWCETNPLESVKRRTVGGKETSRTRVLSMEEIAAWWGRIERHGRMHLRTKLALGLILLTGQRGEEVSELTRADLEGHWWVIGRNKSSREHQVWLNPPARTLLRVAFSTLGDEPFGYKRGMLAKAVHRMGSTWTPHDLRRTMATHLAELGVEPHVVERMLNHALPGVAGVYNRALYADQTRAAWMLWGKQVWPQRAKREPAAAGSTSHTQEEPHD